MTYDDSGILSRVIFFFMENFVLSYIIGALRMLRSFIGRSESSLCFRAHENEEDLFCLVLNLDVLFCSLKRKK